MKLFFTPQAERQAAEMDSWWREHRPGARDLFARELGIRCTDPVWRERHGVGKLLAWNRIASERRRRCGQSADACSSVGIGRGGGTVSGPISAASWAWSRRERVRAQYLGASSR